MWVAQTPTSSGLHLFVSFVLLPSSLEPNGGPYVLWYTSWFVQSLTATNHRSTRLTEWWMKWTGTFCLDDYHWFIQGPIDSDDLKCRISHVYIYMYAFLYTHVCAQCTQFAHISCPLQGQTPLAPLVSFGFFPPTWQVSLDVALEGLFGMFLGAEQPLLTVHWLNRFICAAFVTHMDFIILKKRVAFGIIGI